MNKYIDVINFNDAKNIIIENDLNTDDLTDYTVGLYVNNKLVGTGSLYKNIIKLVAIKKAYQKENLLSLIITKLITELTLRGYDKYFLYTKESEAKYFISLGFKEIVSAKGISFLENSLNPITTVLSDIAGGLDLNDKSVGAVVVNCNPPTLGHIYLITEAAKKHDKLLVFLVSEDRSFFPYEKRKKMLSEAIKDLKNVYLLPSTNYLISSSTFPTYFLKDLSKKSEIEMALDVKIFTSYFMPIFNISKRYVGSEEKDAFTNAYNNTLKASLGDKLVIYERFKINDVIVSGSLVREYYKAGKLKEIKSLVPEATYKELLKWEIVF